MRPRYEALFTRMRDPDPDLADAAFDAVLFDREEAVPDLVECLRRSRKDPLMRWNCVQLLGFSGAKEAIPVLLESLDDRDAAVRAEACRSLEDLDATEALQALKARMEDLDAHVREAAEEAVASITGLAHREDQH
jgi:HEAT repeat protein